ncbi:zinc finger domain-containing protein [Paramyrothecium foliicola]|nr:zinc finger domain-containing protein [Paramyrothecium foliicola]
MTLQLSIRTSYCEQPKSIIPALWRRRRRQSTKWLRYELQTRDTKYWLTNLDKYNISIETIEKDLTTERPLWILSAYAPGKGAPEQLFGGYPREQSFEELRLHYLAGKAAGNEQQALNEAQQLYQNAEEQMKNALVNLSQAAQFVVEGENRHPNRLDICQQGMQGAPFGEFLVGKRSLPAAPASANPFGAAQSSSPFGQGQATTQANPFGQPPAPASQPNPFGSAPRFGQPAQLGPAGAQSSPFGAPAQPSPFGTQAQPAQTTATFGSASSLGQKPSPFQQQATQTGSQGVGFGQTSQLNQRPNPFASQPNAGASPFGTSQANAGASPFGAGQPNTGANPFGAKPNAFASDNSNNTANANPFGAPNNNNNNNNNNNTGGFPTAANNAAQPSPFATMGQSQGAAAPNPFGQPNQAPAQNANNPFAQPAAQQQQTQQQGMGGFPSQQGMGGSFEQSKPNPFGQPSNAFATPAATQPAPQGMQGSAAANNPYPEGSSRQHPPPGSYITRSMDGRIATFKGKPVEYRDGKAGIRAFNGTWTRIWFPDGPPACYKDTQLPLEKYDDRTKAQWATFAQQGSFADGLMPDLPPPREVTSWDF